MHLNGFNAVRVPLAADVILNPRHPCTLKGDPAAVRSHNPGFGAMSYIDQVAEVARVAGESGLLVLLDMHVLAAGVWPDGGNVYGRGRQALFDAWDHLAEKLCDPVDYWNVFAADLKNEPYGMAWGDASSPSSWSELASVLGRHLHAKCPRWAIFVEGVGGTPGSRESDKAGRSGRDVASASRLFSPSNRSFRASTVRLPQ